MRYTPSSGDIIYMSNGDQIQVDEDRSTPTQLLVWGRCAGRDDHDYGPSCILIVNRQRIEYVAQ